MAARRGRPVGSPLTRPGDGGRYAADTGEQPGHAVEQVVGHDQRSPPREASSPGPRNPVGWLLLAAAVFPAGTAAAAPVIGGVQPPPLAPGWGFADLVAVYSWPLSIGLFLPLAPLLFPDGTLPSRRWWPLVVLVVVGGMVFVASAGGELPGALTTVGDLLNGAVRCG
jgi:hypothetical protein